MARLTRNDQPPHRPAHKSLMAADFAAAGLVAVVFLCLTGPRSLNATAISLALVAAGLAACAGLRDLYRRHG